MTIATQTAKKLNGYPTGYRGANPITEQCDTLKQFFPYVGYADEKITQRGKLKQSEGWFAIPKWHTIAPSYAMAVRKVLDAIKEARSGHFFNYREEQIVDERLRQTLKTKEAFAKLAEKQESHKVLAVPAQFGKRYQSLSVQQARESFTSNEFGLGAFAVGIMLLTHPERLQQYEDLWIDCAGDEFDEPESEEYYNLTPFFNFGNQQTKFAVFWNDCPRNHFGSVSGFLPQ